MSKQSQHPFKWHHFQAERIASPKNCLSQPAHLFPIAKDGGPSSRS
jgi:hypothetical protein